MNPEKRAIVATMALNGTNGADTQSYIRWNAEGVEKVPPHEKEDIQAVADLINTMQRTQFNNHGHMFSGRWPGGLIEHIS